MIRDQRRLVPVVPGEEDAALPSRWDADLPRNERAWWQEGWQATAAPVKEMTAKLIPIVTTAQTIDAVELAQTYIHRWPAQENVIKDYLLPLGLDTNHGFAKMAVENSEVAKRRIHLVLQRDFWGILKGSLFLEVKPNVSHGRCHRRSVASSKPTGGAAP